MPENTPPYGADLPRPPGDGEWFSEGNVVASIGVDIATDPYVDIKEPGTGWPFGPAIAALPAVWSALDDANARVAELEAERDTWLSMWQELVGVVHAVVHKDTSNGAQEAIELLLDSLDGRGLLPPDYPELPTEEAA